MEWILVDSDGTQLSDPCSGTLVDASIAADDRSVIALVPAADVLLTNVHIPARSSTKIRKALPFALEEDLAEDIERLVRVDLASRVGQIDGPLDAVTKAKFLCQLHGQLAIRGQHAAIRPNFIDQATSVM